MLAIVGDVHGDVNVFRKIVDEIEKHPEITAIIQVGDLGWYQYNIAKWRAQQFNIPIYWIKGNHEEFPLLRGIETVTEVCPNLFYVPNGTVLTLDGRKIAFVGGAASVDKLWRLGTDWWDDENIKDEDIQKLDSVDKVDLLITHIPPQSIIQRNFDPMNLLMFNLPITWRDSNADKIEKLWKRLNYPKIYCGHMHKKVRDYQCQILDINELVVV